MLFLSQELSRLSGVDCVLLNTFRTDNSYVKRTNTFSQLRLIGSNLQEYNHVIRIMYEKCFCLISPKYRESRRTDQSGATRSKKLHNAYIPAIDYLVIYFFRISIARESIFFGNLKLAFSSRFFIKRTFSLIISPTTIQLTVECPNVTLCYKVKMTFLNPKFNQIRMEIANFWLLFGL